MERSPGLRTGVAFIFVFITATLAGCSTAETKSQPAATSAVPPPTVQVAPHAAERESLICIEPLEVQQLDCSNSARDSEPARVCHRVP